MLKQTKDIQSDTPHTSEYGSLNAVPPSLVSKKRTKLTDDERRYRRAAQDILNHIAQSLMMSGVLTLPPYFARKMNVNILAALIETRMKEGKQGE